MTIIGEGFKRLLGLLFIILFSAIGDYIFFSAEKGVVGTVFGLILNVAGAIHLSDILSEGITKFLKKHIEG